MSHNETHTLQLWPSGDGYEYKGEASAYDKTHRLRRHRYNGERPERWRKGTKIEWASILVEVRVNGYIEHEVLKCDSMLVSDHLRSGDGMPEDISREWSYDEITNLYPDPSEWDASQCREWLDDHGDQHVDEFDPEDTDSLQDAVRDNAEPAEIYEWWAVSDWLAEQLTAIGEPVLDNAYGQWWGRTCTGQAMKMDGTLQEVARRFA